MCFSIGYDTYSLSVYADQDLTKYGLLSVFAWDHVFTTYHASSSEIS
jgi:hypothetical protein